MFRLCRAPVALITGAGRLGAWPSVVVGTWDGGPTLQEQAGSDFTTTDAHALMPTNTLRGTNQLSKGREHAARLGCRK